MHSITPCQRRISDRFPVASFAVNVPSNRLFEIVCTTDPQLLRPEYRGRRSANNFFTSRSSGLLRAPAGHATFLVPAEQLKRFAGQSRIYYALASYDSPRGDDLKMSVTPSAGSVPSIMLSHDFTGRSLDRARIRGGAKDGKYGGPTPVLTWGGDTLAAPPAPTTATAAAYDDGFSPDLWTSDAPTARGAESGTPEEPPDPEIVYDEAGLGEAYGRGAAPSIITSAPRQASQSEPAGFEDAAALRRASVSYGRATTSQGGAEPPGAEDVRGDSHIAYGKRDDLAEPAGAEDVRAVAYGGNDFAEPVGAEDVRAESHPGYGRVDDVAEPPGIEHPSEARFGAAAAFADAEPQGSEDARIPAVVDPRPTGDVPGTGVDAGWDDDDDEAELVASPGSTGEPLTIRRKFEILLPAAANESGTRRYSAVLGDIDGHGLHWGLVLFTQRSGLLGKVLSACERRDPTQFRVAFGAANTDRLLQVTTASTPEARLAPVASARLWDADWIARFRTAGSVVAFQAAQNEIAIEYFFDRNLGFAAALGLLTDRALAMTFDRAIHMGTAAARQWILQAVSPITDDAKRAAALSALGHADLAAFQRASNLEATGRFGNQTHAALVGALRGLGDRAPFPIPGTTEMLDKLVQAATGRAFESRVRALRTATTYSDAVQRVV